MTYMKKDKPEEQKEAMKDISEFELANLKKFLGTKDFLLGYLTIVDFLFYTILCMLKVLFEGTFAHFADVFEPYMKRFEAQPGIKEYIAGPRYLKYVKY